MTARLWCAAGSRAGKMRFSMARIANPRRLPASRRASRKHALLHGPTASQVSLAIRRQKAPDWLPSPIVYTLKRNRLKSDDPIVSNARARST
jgi:hypothetical protein